MKNISLLVWITQLGLSVAVPLAGFILLAVWLRSSMGWGNWVIWVGIVLGIYCAVQGFIGSLKTMRQLAGGNEKPEDSGVAYNDHE